MPEPEATTAGQLPTPRLGPVLNTIEGRSCPTCLREGPMLVHPEWRSYPTCGHRFELPPIRICVKRVN